MQEQISWARRVFVWKALKGWLGLVVAPSAYAAIRIALSSGNSTDVKPQDCGAATQLAPGSSKLIHHGGDKVLLFRTRTGKIHALSGVCTHLGCSLRFAASQGDGEIACNCHESRFDLNGQNLSGPAPNPLQEYHLQEVDGRLILGGKVANE